MSLALVVHGAFLLAAMALAFTTRQSTAIPNALLVVSLGILLSSGWAATSAPVHVSWVFLVLGPLTLLWLAVRRAGAEPLTRAGRLLSAVLAPLVAGIWAIHVGDLADIRAPQFSIFVATTAAVLVLAAAWLLPRRSRDWLQTVAEMDAVVFAVVLLVATTMAISRSPWAIALELVSLAGLVGLAYADRRESLLPRWLAPAAALGVALLLQTHLLRWFGPSGHLDLGDIARMRLPTLVSLLWAAMGGVLTVWARRKGSRPVWVAGACLLVAAAVKLVLVDFGSLGQLANILAVIAAGVVFMLVGWLAPLPPPAPPKPRQQPPELPQAPVAPIAVAPAVQTPPVPPAASAAGKATHPESAKPTVEAAKQAATGDGSDYWERNARKPADSSRLETESEARSNRKIAWIIAILAAMVLPMAQCSRSTLDSIRQNLGFGNRTIPVQATPPFAAPPTGHRRLTGSPQEPVAELDVASIQMETECSQWAAKLPADYVVYAAGAYRVPNWISRSTIPITGPGGFDVTIHCPTKRGAGSGCL